jgi:hypothetical protein
MRLVLAWLVVDNALACIASERLHTALFVTLHLNAVFNADRPSMLVVVDNDAKTYPPSVTPQQTFSVLPANKVLLAAQVILSSSQFPQCKR